MKRSKLITLIVSIIFLLSIFVAFPGCLEDFPEDEEPTTGTIEVIYNSGPDGEDNVVIYLENDSDTERLGQIPSDNWRTFDDIEPDNYKIFAENLDGLLLDSKGITVYRGETTTVELGW